MSKPKALRAACVAGFRSGYHVPGAERATTEADNPHEWLSDKWAAWLRGYRMGRVLGWVERDDALARVAGVVDQVAIDQRRLRAAREAVNEAPQLDLLSDLFPEIRHAEAVGDMLRRVCAESGPVKTLTTLVLHHHHTPAGHRTSLQVAGEIVATVETSNP